MLSDEQKEIISEALTPLFDYLEQEIITDIARRVGKTMELTRTAELQAIQMRDLGYSPAKIRAEVFKRLRADKAFMKEVEKNTIESKKEIKKIIEDIVKKAREECDDIISNAGKMSWIDDLSVWESQGIELGQNKRLNSLIEGIQKQTSLDILNLSQTTGFKALRGYTSIENLYREELNKAMIKLASGAFDANKIIRDVVKDLARSGLRSIDYASGYSKQLDSAVRLAIRTGSHQLAGQITSQNIIDTKEPLVYVQAHENARNKGEGVQNHEEWQGKVYYVTPGDYSEEAKRIGQSEIIDLYDATGYSIDGSRENNPLGLYGYNCRHNINPWFIGASDYPKKIQPTPERKYKGKVLDGYAQTQELRRQEQKIRSLKREREALSTLKQPTYEIDAEIKQRTEDYKATCLEFGAPYQTTKLSYECGTSDITKTNAYKRYLKEVEKSTKK